VSFASRIIVVALAPLALSATVARGQVVETPVSFDSAGKVRAITPALVSRFALQSPAWPVQHDCYLKALSPVSAWPSTSECTSCVPS
jgi:hypothetical protein